MFALSPTPLIFSNGIDTLYWNFNTSPAAEYVLTDLSLQNPTFSVVIKRMPAIGPAVVYMEHRVACNNFSESRSRVLKFLPKILPSRPSGRILAP
uniref:Uncharacterized protein n=1 Tax=Helianthus annuus TaxID=4232 RepID=A0A251UGK3_HELAN